MPAQLAGHARVGHPSAANKTNGVIDSTRLDGTPRLVPPSIEQAQGDGGGGGTALRLTQGLVWPLSL